MLSEKNVYHYETVVGQIIVYTMHVPSNDLYGTVYGHFILHQSPDMTERITV